ncbi:VC0807 family protein [Viridibacterium curvum]
MFDRKRLHLILDLGCNIALPWLAYVLAKPHLGEMGALLVSAAPPLLWALVELIRRRTLDALSMLVLGGIGLSLIAMLMGGTPRLLLLRESLISGLIGLAFLVSVPFAKPLVYFLARATAARQDSAAQSDFDAWWQLAPSRQLLRGITLGWGIGLTAEALVRALLAWHMEPEDFLLYSPFVSYGLIGLLLLWTAWYRRRFLDREQSRQGS